MNEKQKKFDAQLWKKAINSNHTCEHPNCTKPAINSHILQRNKIMNRIAENGEVMISEVDKFQSNIFPFKSCGLKNALTFKGFCNEHDTSLFSPIEQVDKVDYTKHDNLLLFNYRTLLNEKRRKENLIIFWKSILQEETLLFDRVELEKSAKIAKLT